MGYLKAARLVELTVAKKVVHSAVYWVASTAGRWAGKRAAPMDILWVVRKAGCLADLMVARLDERKAGQRAGK